ncbi:TPA: glycosyltransferase family 2 protein [Photobacterium damselae]
MNNEIISVVVLSYNAEKTILETLNSILEQSYGSTNIDLIVSDDGSKDSTESIVSSWVNAYGDNFYSVTLLFSNENKGISHNCNKGWKSSSAKWIKTIAADDILLVDCLLDNKKFTNENDIDCLFSYMKCFSDCGVVDKILPSNNYIEFFSLSPREQFETLCIESFNFAPTSFLKKEVLEDIGYCDEQYKLIEDLPLWLKITKNGYKLSFFESVTVGYRIGNSLSNSTDRLVNLNFIQQIETLHQTMIWPNLPLRKKWRVLDKKIDFFSWRLTAKLFNNKRNKLSLSFRYFILLFRPSSYIVILRKFKRKKVV